MDRRKKKRKKRVLWPSFQRWRRQHQQPLKAFGHLQTWREVKELVRFLSACSGFSPIVPCLSLSDDQIQNYHTDLTQWGFFFISCKGQNMWCYISDVNTLKAAKLLGFSSFSFSFFSARGAGSSSARTSAPGSEATSGTTFTSSSVMGVAITSATVATGIPTSGGGSWTSVEELWTGT